MSKKFFETKEFAETNKLWQNKLKNSGFSDIETKNDIKSGNINKEIFTVNHKDIQYNQQCVAYFNSGKIKDKIDLFVFEKHCEGRSTAEISKLMREFKFRQLTKMAIHLRITRLLKCAGIEPVTFSF